MKSLRQHEGYMLIDNRNNAGISDEQMIALGYPVGAGRGLYESATYTCSHCNFVVVMEPKRTRERGFCRGCNQRICDACEAVKAKTMMCKTMAQVIDETLDAVEHNRPVSPLVLLP
jgi:hypothetical protein